MEKRESDDLKLACLLFWPPCSLTGFAGDSTGSTCWRWALSKRDEWGGRLKKNCAVQSAGDRGGGRGRLPQVFYYRARLRLGGIPAIFSVLEQMGDSIFKMLRVTCAKLSETSPFDLFSSVLYKRC